MDRRNIEDQMLPSSPTEVEGGIENVAFDSALPSEQAQTAEHFTSSVPDETASQSCLEDHKATLSKMLAPVKRTLPDTLTAEEIGHNAQQLIDDLNSKRKQDTQLLADFKQALEIHVQKTYVVVEQHLYQNYEKQRGVLEIKLQKLFACLDRISKLESELQDFKQSLQVLYQEMNK
ncbi:hypothetical protein ACJMK2_041709 [Sinanodonta woodiana]|uniref:Synaptonemal complex central element protein 2 n=1 Tax=Sinanodonta woodiana TaxID=1069815 RepID=A0ABD3W539_SINWO